MDISNREKEIWIELVISLLVAIYYFKHAFSNGGFSDMFNPELGKVVINAILFSIFATIALTIFFNTKDDVKKDERYYAIDAKANSCAYYSFCLLCVGIIVQTFISEKVGYFSDAHLLNINLSSVLHLILLSLIISGTVKSVTQLFFYRRGYL